MRGVAASREADLVIVNGFFESFLREPDESTEKVELVRARLRVELVFVDCFGVFFSEVCVAWSEALVTNGTLAVSFLDSCPLDDDEIDTLMFSSSFLPSPIFLFVTLPTKEAVLDEVGMVFPPFANVYEVRTAFFTSSADLSAGSLSMFVLAVKLFLVKGSDCSSLFLSSANIRSFEILRPKATGLGLDFLRSVVRVISLAGLTERTRTNCFREMRVLPVGLFSSFTTVDRRLDDLTAPVDFERTIGSCLTCFLIVKVPNLLLGDSFW